MSCHTTSQVKLGRPVEVSSTLPEVPLLSTKLLKGQLVLVCVLFPSLEVAGKIPDRPTASQFFFILKKILTVRVADEIQPLVCQPKRVAQPSPLYTFHVLAPLGVIVSTPCEFPVVCVPTPFFYLILGSIWRLTTVSTQINILICFFFA